MLKGTFQWITASVRGYRHTLEGKPNQDAFHLIEIPEALILCLSDGCGSMPKSEIGSQASVTVAATVLVEHLRNVSPQAMPTAFFSGPDLIAISDEIRRRLRELALKDVTPTHSLRRVLEDGYLATLICVIVMEEQTYILSCGDGTVYVNGVYLGIQPFPRRAPPFLVYALTHNVLLPKYQLSLLHALPTEQLSSLLIATDGVDEIRDMLTRSSTAFWSQDKYFASGDALTRVLRDLREVFLLCDDTTIICLRRYDGVPDSTERPTLRCPPPRPTKKPP